MSRELLEDDSTLPINDGSLNTVSRNSLINDDLQELTRSTQQAPQPLQQQGEALVTLSSSMSIAKVPAAPRHGSMLSSLKAQYRKLRTFKGTVRALINLKRSPLLSVVKVTSPTVPTLIDDQRSAVLEVPRISATAASSVQSQVRKLACCGRNRPDNRLGGHVPPTRQFGSLYKGQLGKAREPPTTSPYDCTYASLWNCALQNGEKKLKFDDYEAYMLCLHRLILPEFNIIASKELIRDDWKRDSGEQDFLDYSFFHLSMFELVDLWTDTVDPEDYVSLLYCISHCLTFVVNKSHVLKSLEDVSNVDIVEKSKGVTMEVIEQDLQLELSSEAFKFYRDQIKLATKAAHNVEQAVSGKVDSPREPSQSSGLHVSHIEALGSTLRTGTQDPNALGLSLNPGAADSRTSREPFTVRAAAVAEAAANMAVPASPSNSGQSSSAQRALLQSQQHIPQFDANGPYINNSSLTAPLITIISSKAPTPINKINLQLHEMQATRPQTPHEGRLGTPISSPRASNAITAQAIGIFISSQQQPKPPTSTRPINLGTILSSDHHPPKVSKALQQFQQDESPSLVAVVPGLVPATMPLTISGKPAAPNIRVESAHQQPSKEKAPVLLEDGSITRKFNGVTRTSPPKDDSKSLLSPRYVVAEPAVSHRSTPISTLKQASIQPHGSIRGFTGIKNSPRIRQQPSRLVTDPATSYLQQHRQQRHLSEPQELVVAPKLG
ncbi:hypothetical protein GN958_ATG22134 [Phytophthora infestans]|uniref:Uncharacterized protein n=1 Tax=Phytophthora infestans TaxID=4787 RepID=A0A8S9TM21_PHYIN|nr:hypothetical protein GN958_ATG22134 [Phytophthora infestans]